MDKCLSRYVACMRMIGTWFAYSFFYVPLAALAGDDEVADDEALEAYNRFRMATIRYRLLVENEGTCAILKDELAKRMRSSDTFRERRRESF